MFHVSIRRRYIQISNDHHFGAHFLYYRRKPSLLPFSSFSNQRVIGNYTPHTVQMLHGYFEALLEHANDGCDSSPVVTNALTVVPWMPHERMLILTAESKHEHQTVYLLSPLPSLDARRAYDHETPDKEQRLPRKIFAPPSTMSG